jgi:hypothetical protein
VTLFFALGVALRLFSIDDPVEDFESPVLDGWERVSSDVHPPYNTCEPVRDPARAKSGRQFLRMTTMGGSTALLRSPGRAWPVDAGRPYRMSVFARLNGTRRNTASATILWLNGDAQRIEESRSAPLTRAGGWNELSVEVARVPSGAVAASIRLDFEGDDVRGECDFDRLSLAPVELLLLRPVGRETAVFTPEEEPRFRLSLDGAPDGAYRVTCLLKSSEGPELRRSTLLSDHAAELDFQALRPGAYDLEAAVDGRNARRSLCVLVLRPSTPERLPEIPPALAQAVVRGERNGPDGPTRWWLAEQVMHQVLGGAVPAADPGLFPPEVRVAAFRKADSALLALWSDLERELPLSLNEGAALRPPFGERRPLGPGERIRLGPVPVFVVGIDPLLFDLKLTIAGGELPLQLNPSTRTLRLHNPYRTQVLRDVRVRLENLPAGWRVWPRSSSAATLAGDGDLSEDLQIALPPTEAERDQELRFEVSFVKNGREEVTHLSRMVRLSPAIRIEAAVTDGPQAESRRMSIRIANASDRTMSVVLRARLPSLPEQMELLRSLAPGSLSAPFEYVVKDVHLIDPARLEAEVDAQESLGGRAAASRKIPIR